MAGRERRTVTYYSDRTAEVWLSEEDGRWTVWCMDCGNRVGFCRAGDEFRAADLDERHRLTLHLD